MNRNTKNPTYIKFIISLKKEKGYRCQACHGKEYYERKQPASMICKSCNYEESATANTAFHGLKISVPKVLNILLKIQEAYMNFMYLGSINYGGSSAADIEDINEKRATTFARLSVRKISKKFKIQKKTVEALIERIGQWMPKKYSRKSAAEEEWLHGLKSITSKQIYTSLFNLLFNDDEPRSKKEILYFLITKKFKLIDDF